jgi:hypothetical protein
VKLVASLLTLLSHVLSMWREWKVAREVRADVQEQLDANVEKAEAAVAVVDPERDERLRNRFDRSGG